MKNYGKIIGIIAAMAVIGLLVTACDLLGGRRLTGSIYVNHGNQRASSAARSVNGTDETIIELYIHQFQYWGKKWYNSGQARWYNDTINIVYQKGWGAENEGWFLACDSFPIINDGPPGFYPMVSIEIHGLRIGGEHGDVFPFSQRAHYGQNIFGYHGGAEFVVNENHFPDVFDGITYDLNVHHITTVLEVDYPAILECWVKRDGNWVLRRNLDRFDVDYKDLNPLSFIRVYGETR